MSDQYPTTVFHRGLRRVADMCVIDPWVTNRAAPCPSSPTFGLEDMDCVLNNFKQLPTRFRGAQERVPFRDLTVIRTDPQVIINRTLCGSGALQDLLSAFVRNGLECSVLCGAQPYGDPPCPPLDDDMGMLMTGCYDDQMTHDPGFMIPRSPAPFGATVGVYPEPVAPQCPTQTSSGSTVCVENCATVVNGMSYVGDCWFAQMDTICMCGSSIYVKVSAPELIGCNCCGQQPPVPTSSSASTSSGSGSSSTESSSTSQSSSESSSSSAPADPCPTECVTGSVNWGMHAIARDVSTQLAYNQAYLECGNYELPNACSAYATCGMHSNGCITGVAYDGGDGFWYVEWWRCCFLA